MWFQFKPYVSVAKRRANAAREVAKLKKQGQDIQPVAIEGRKIATTFWGQSWCKNLEAYSDFSNRLPRGRTYVCNGSVVDLQIKPGKITALVSGSSLYRIAIDIGKLPEPTWKSIRAACAGQIGSIVELLQGKLSRHVMEIVTRQENGLFPKPKEIAMKCSCPDWAGLCKHLAAVLYGVGARLDRRPELLFQLRQVDHLELVEQAVEADSGRAAAKAGKKTIASGDLADVFGIDIDAQTLGDAPAAKAGSRRSARSSKAGGGGTSRRRTRGGDNGDGGNGDEAKPKATRRRTAVRTATATKAADSCETPSKRVDAPDKTRTRSKSDVRLEKAKKLMRLASSQGAKRVATTADVVVAKSGRRAVSVAAASKTPATRRKRSPK